MPPFRKFGLPILIYCNVFLNVGMAAPSSVPLVIYDDQLQNGFVGNEWQDGTHACLLNLGYQDQKASGTSSAELNLNHYCTAFFTQPGTYVDGTYEGGFVLGDYASLEFDFLATSPAQTTFGIAMATNSWTVIGTQVLIQSYAQPATQWQHVKIPLSDFDLMAATVVEGIQFRNNDWQTNNEVYGPVLVDNLAFTPNLAPPELTGISNSDLTHVKIGFSKAVDAATATTVRNYRLASTGDTTYKNGSAPQSAVLSTDQRNVILGVAPPLKSGTDYTVTVNGIGDQLIPPHTIAANASLGFTAQYDPIAFAIDATASVHPISPEIYGLSAAPADTLADLNFTVNRQGGNTASTYNWEQDASNHAFDWYYESIAESDSDVPGHMADQFIEGNAASGARSMITIPTIGWVAKLGPNRQKLASFSQAKYGPQTGSDAEWFADAGNGILQSTGKPITDNDPNDAYVPSDVNFQSGFVDHLLGRWGTGPTGGVGYFVMDNEPSIWQSTHMDIHPIGPGMEEIRDAIVKYGGMVKQKDPAAVVAGPEEWGWPGYLYSGLDQQTAAANGWSAFPDKEAHGGMDYLPWLLDQLHKNDIATGKRILDVLTVHYYPQSNEYSSNISPGTMQMRNRSTRSLWDTAYTDESWINDKVYLIPRLKQWVADYYPGTKIGITEYNWGAESHMNGATAIADVLGIFGREGLDIATYWTAPASGTPVYQAMKLYRNYDGAKATFGDTSVSDVAPDPDRIASFAALRSQDGALTIMAINKQLSTDSAVAFQLNHFQGAGLAQVYQLGASGTIKRLADATYSGDTLDASLPAQSVTLFVLPPTGSAADTFHIIAPNGGETYTAGAPMQVTWCAGDLKKGKRLTINLSRNSGGRWKTILSGVPFTTDCANSKRWKVKARYWGENIRLQICYPKTKRIPKRCVSSAGDFVIKKAGGN